MRVLQGDPRWWGPAPARGTAVTIGVYDGVHRGHQAVLADLARRGEELEVGQCAVLMFDRHPLALVAPERAPRALTTMEQRLEILDSLNVDLVGVLPFERIRTMHPGVFTHQVLLDALGARLVVVGTNFRFGLDRSGDVAFLREEGLRHGFDVEAVALLHSEGTTCSSSMIRTLLRAGDTQRVEEALGRPFELRGVVVVGDGRGQALGFPTANLSFPAEMELPARGVYAAMVDVEGELVPAVANVGRRPTFGGDGLTVEAHLLGFEGDLYGHHLAVHFKNRLRNERQFAGADELVAQIKKDVQTAARVLAENEREKGHG